MDRYLQILKISWISALIVSIVTAILMLLFFLIYENTATYTHNDWLWSNVGIAIIMLILIFFANKYTKRQLNKIRQNDLSAKLVSYLSICRKQMFCYVLVCLFGLVAIFLSRQIELVIFDILAILLIVNHRPTKIKVKFDLALTEEDLAKFDNIKFQTKL
ncbi:MAG: hypothetical protein ACTTJH_02970 [Bacteroidales bacterium]